MFPPHPRSVRVLGNLERQVDAAFAELIHAPWSRAPAALAYEPAVDLRELEREYLAVVDLPGVMPGEVNVEVEGQALVLRGSRTSEQWARAGTTIYAERLHGEFLRRIFLPQPVDPTQLEVSFAQGLLLIRIAKSRSESGRPTGGEHGEHAV